MNYKSTTLWQSAFEVSRDDACPAEQARLVAVYEAMRVRASALVAKIQADLPHMTVHDVTHLDALWEMASIAAGESFNLNPAEAFVFGGAVLLHDAAMSLAAFPGGISELRHQTEWRDLYARHTHSVAQDDTVGIKDAENRATSDALRFLHAKQAENLPSIAWEGPNKEQMFIIEDQQVRNFYGPKIGKLAYSHWWSIAKVEQELAGTLGALPNVTNCTVDLLKIACLLRVADAMHLDQRRAPAFEFALSQPVGVSADHWKFQERMAKPYVQADALVYTAQPPFGADLSDAWWTAFDALQMVDGELRAVDRVLRERQKTPLLVRRVEGAHSPSDLARTIETVGWTPVDSTVRVSDVPNIVAMLGGSKLYGEDPAAPIRELVQNGLDAITARRRLQSRPSKWGDLRVQLQKRSDGYWLCVEDNGVGMSQTVLTGPLIDFGKSFWKSTLAIQEFPGLASTGMKARGKYGIGFFSIFMLGDQVRVITRRYDRDFSSARVLEFRHGIGSRPNLHNADLKEVPLDGGTRVEVRLKTNPDEPGGLLYRDQNFRTETIKLEDLIAAIAPACDVSITVEENDEVIGSTGAGDWLEIETSDLLRRIVGGGRNADRVKHPSEELSELRDEDGRIYGRARIATASLWSPTGLITVDGLAASRAGCIAGILLGVETTASRNAAVPIVPAPVLAAWASDQAISIAAATVSDSDKAEAGTIVMICGGDIAELPICRWRGDWMNTAQFLKAIESLDEFVLHESWITHEDDDDVTQRAFNETFSEDSTIAHTANRQYGYGVRSDWIATVTQGHGTTPVKVIQELVAKAWGEMDHETEFRVVGEVNGTDIHREVHVFTRMQVD